MKNFLRQNGILLLVIAALLSVLIWLGSAVLGGNTDPLSSVANTVTAPIRSGVSTVLNWVENVYTYVFHYEELHTELDELKELDAKVKRPANAFAYTYGSVGAIVMGAGMSLVMTEIGATIGLASAMVPGIAIGVVGLGMALTTYPIYKGMLNARRKKYADQILALSDKLMKQ